MAAYLVRVKETKEFVGIYVAPDHAILAELIDELCGPSACECVRLPPGGITAGDGAPTVPRDGPNAPEDDEPPALFPGGPSLTEDWWERTNGWRRLTWQRVVPEGKVFLPGHGFFDESDERARAVAEQMGT